MAFEAADIELERLTDLLSKLEEGIRSKPPALAEDLLVFAKELCVELYHRVPHAGNETLPGTPTHNETRIFEAAHITSVMFRDPDLKFLQPIDKAHCIGRVGEFEIIGVVGRGGMGVVLHAADPILQRDVAIKILDPQLASNDIARRRFLREARAAAAVSHENVVAVHSVNEDAHSGLPFFVMQLVSGESLEHRLRRQGKLSVAETVQIGVQATAGLAAAHATGLIHRDVKPGNILIEAITERVKLTDFGLARATEDLKLTRTGFVSGTPSYMAPEQAKGDNVDARADLFSLGVVLYECLAGKPPFGGNTPLTVLRRIADDPHMPIRRFAPKIPSRFEQLINGLLAKSPEDRPQSSGIVVEELSRILQEMDNPTPADRRSVAVVNISPLAYLRTMWNLFWSAIRYPMAETTIDLSTGRVIYRRSRLGVIAHV